MDAFSEEIESEGHLIDSGILSGIFEKIISLGGEFDVKEIRIGRRKTEKSYIRLRVTGGSRRDLDIMLKEIYKIGATAKDKKEAVLKRATRDCVIPDNFYSTTNNRTEIFHGGKWVPVSGTMMDKCVVVKGGRASCVPIRDVKRGDMVVVGDDGVRVIPPELPREKQGIFEFMGSTGSSERPTRHIARKVARNMHDTKKAGGKIVMVGGPAIVHTGADDAVAEMIRTGYLDGILAGNALAVHDIEYATMGTSLGMYVRDATLAHKGHRNHMDTVNAVFRAGSIARMVKSGALRSGIMYECVKNKVPFVLAGSIRDDGPLPDVMTDVVEAQRQYKRMLRGADMVLMVATMLHSIATGNMLPADVKIVVVDINQPAVTKLMDRGTWQATGIVSDVGAFMPMVADALKEIRD